MTLPKKVKNEADIRAITYLRDGKPWCVAVVDLGYVTDRASFLNNLRAYVDKNNRGIFNPDKVFFQEATEVRESDQVYVFMTGSYDPCRQSIGDFFGDPMLTPDSSVSRADKSGIGYVAKVGVAEFNSRLDLGDMVAQARSDPALCENNMYDPLNRPINGVPKKKFINRTTESRLAPTGS